MIRTRKNLHAVQRVVIKIGSSLLADTEGGIRQESIDRFAAEIADIRASGVEVAMVSSGAVALGRVHLGWVDRHLTVHEKQAAAAIGQPLLMHAYNNAFSEHTIQIAQMLLTRDDLRHRRRYLNASNTAQTLFSSHILPIVNENDTVMVEEIKFGDNDTLAALVGLLTDADLLIIMTDVDGLYDRNPNRDSGAKRLSLIQAITPEIISMAGAVGSSFGTGGMASKISAAGIATRGGVTTAIISGHPTGMLKKLIQGDDVGSLLLCSDDRNTQRQHWIMDVLHPQGRLIVDAKAEEIILAQGQSLDSMGVQKVIGTFDKGECVDVCGPSGNIARGLVNYNAEEMRKLVGVPSDQIESILGFSDFSSMVHHDNLVLV
ncbi:MAG: glutamate 5-kinase [Mariprofundaceae bacterium]